jgi:hypothetical protein
MQYHIRTDILIKCIGLDTMTGNDVIDSILCRYVPALKKRLLVQD